MLPKNRSLLFSMLPDRLVVGVATLGPIGYKTKAPGTIGSALGLVFTLVVFSQLPLYAHLFIGGILVLLAIPICTEAEWRLRREDPGEVILDEFVAIPFCFLGLFPVPPDQPAWLLFLLGFVLFRFFDILKPLGINRLQKLGGGLGVVADDVGAALATSVVLLLIHHFFNIL